MMMSLLSAYPALAAATVRAAPTSLSLLAQAKDIPEDFQQHIFDVPLAVRVQVDGVYLGDAMVLLSASEQIKLLRFTETSESKITEGDRQLWGQILEPGIALGTFQQNCQDFLEAHFSLENSQLSLISAAAGDTAAQNYYSVPEHGNGLIVSNNVSIASNSRGASGSYGLSALGSVGSWMVAVSAQVDRSSESNARTNSTIQNVYTQREYDRHYLKLGYFTADSSGVFRQINTPGVRVNSMVGVMVGNSDSLKMDSGKASTFPIYVTVNRVAIIEIYRDGVLIYSQNVEAGLQLVDTKALPGGIYPVEVRVLENGVMVSRQDELIYKPTNWADPTQRWRYNLYVGRRHDLFDSRRAASQIVQRDDHASIFGANLNYLLHPRAVVGIGFKQIGADDAVGVSLDWEVQNHLRLYSNLYHSFNYGRGVDGSVVWSRQDGSNIQFGYRDSWFSPDDIQTERLTRSRSVSASANKNFSPRTSLNLRLVREENVNVVQIQGNGQTDQQLARYSGNSVGVTLRHRISLGGHDARIDVRAFDQPSQVNQVMIRNRGVEIGINLTLGRDGRQDRSISATVGTRAAAHGGRDKYGSLSVQQRFEDQVVENIGLTASADRYGLGGSGDLQFNHQLARGNAYLQRASTQSGVSGGINLQSTILIGSDKIATGGGSFLSDAGMIVDVDAEMTPDVVLNAQDSDGRTTRLWQGRNVLPLAAYRPGKVQFEFAGDKDHDAVVTTPVVRYHLNKGGVAHFDVKVLKTFTVLGRLLNAEGQPLKGAQVLNHAGRTFTEPDGFFSLELSEQTPTLEISQGNDRLCSLSIDKDLSKMSDKSLMVGDLLCTPLIASSTDLTEVKL